MYLKLPEDAACVSVIVLPERDVFHSSAVGFKVALHMFKEPGFKVQANSVDLILRETHTNRKKREVQLMTH